MNRPSFFTLTLATSLLLGACAMQNNSFVSNEPMTVQEEAVSVDLPSNAVSKSELNNLADDIKRRGKSDVTVTVHYALKKPYKDSQRIAQVQGERVKAYLRSQGVKHSILVLTEPDQELGANTIRVGFQALKANAPAHCKDITHADADRFDFAKDGGYYYGCTGDSYLSQMIARPGDLLGNDATSSADSQRLGKAQELYRSGERATSKEDEGVSASNVYVK